MKGIIISLILMVMFANAGIEKKIVEVMSMDLTNVNKSEYRIYSEIEEKDILEGQNLCLEKDFKVDAYTCKKPIYYVYVNEKESADILIMNEYVDNSKVVVCKEDDRCDIIYSDGKKKLKINIDKMKDKGYVPDPSRK